MTSVTSHVLRAMWELIPGNPILVRVVAAGSKRPRHLFIRAGYLVVLFVAMLTAVVGAGTHGGSLSETAREFSQAFKVISLVQLALMCFLAPVFAAAAITQERDAQTYDILLTTPLSNAQIVLGTLCSRLTFVLLLLLSGLPIVCITMIYGGVTTPIILRSFAVSAATAIFTASLAIAVSVIQVGTRRTVVGFYLFVAVYLAALYFLSTLQYFQVPEAPPVPGRSDLPPVSYFSPFHPFLALFTALNMVPSPAASDVAHYTWPMSYLLADPTRGFIVVNLLGSVLIVGISLFFVRSGAKQGEVSWLRGLFSTSQGEGEERRQSPRHVWSNPVAWREAATRASITSRNLLRIVYVGGGTLAGLVLFYLHLSDRMGTGAVGIEQTRAWLSGLVFVEFAAMLLVATNLAAAAISREREAQTLDLLLTTPLTSRYVVWGKLRGLVSFTLPLILVPVGTCALFAVHALVAPSRSVVYPEGVVLLAAQMVIFSAFACLLGLFRSLKSPTTLRATLSSLAILVFVCGGASMCGFQFISSANPTAAVMAPFTPFTSVFIAIDPVRWMDLDPTTVAQDLPRVRLWALIGGVLTLVIYGAVIHTAYRSMVRNFDMTLRKQSA